MSAYEFKPHVQSCVCIYNSNFLHMYVLLAWYIHVFLHMYIILHADCAFGSEVWWPELKGFNVRVDDLDAIDLTFLQGFDQPTLAYLAEVRLLIHVHIHVCVYMYLYGCICRQKYYRLYVTSVFSPSKLQGMVEGVVWVCLVSTSKILDYPLFPQRKCTDGLLGQM